MVFVVLALHVVFWAPFVIRGELDKRAGAQQTGPAAHRNPAATALVWLHTAGLAVSYAGLVWGFVGAPITVVWPNPDNPPQVLVASLVELPMAFRLLGVPIFLGTTWMIVRVMMVFRSWRLRAELTAEHQLCTVGPFEVVRHPIYTGLVLLTIGSFVLVPNLLTALGILTNFAAGDLRARAEERLLLGAFGERYAAYMARTRRFLPGVY